MNGDTQLRKKLGQYFTQTLFEGKGTSDNDTHIELLSTYGKASAYFYDSTPDEESKYKTFTLTKRHD